MRKMAVVVVGYAMAIAALAAEERQSLSLVQAQPLCAGEVEATGRLLPQFTALVGSRLAAHITTWGCNDAGEFLDVGMRVTAGWVLFKVDSGTFQAKVTTKQAALAAAETALANLVAPTRPEQIAVLKAAVAELDARLQDRQHDAERFRRLVETDKTMPLKRLEEVRLELAVLQSQLAAAQARLDEALAGPTKAQIAVADAKVQEARAELAAAQLDLSDTETKAPFAGVITRRFKGLGDYVAGAPFVEVLELVTADRLEAELRLPEAYLPQLAAGQTTVRLASPLAREALDLPVTRIVPQIDTASGTFGFRVAVPPDKAGGLVPGAFVTAQLKLPAVTDAVLIPLRALLVDGARTSVMLAENGRMVRRKVEVGNRLTEGVVVRVGLKAGEQVVVGPPAELRDGAPLPPSLLGK